MYPGAARRDSIKYVSFRIIPVEILDISLSYSFKRQTDVFRYKPTAYHMEFGTNYKLADEFFAADEGIFYIWGHSYEFDINDTWAEFEKFCEYVANRPDVYYGTNKEIII